MSACMAVVLNGNTEIKYFPFHNCASAEVATDMADEWRYAAIEAIGWDEAHRFHLRAVRPIVVLQLPSGAVVECDLDDVDIDAVTGRILTAAFPRSGLTERNAIPVIGTWMALKLSNTSRR